MSPAERIAAAIAAGDVSRRDGEQLAGFLALAHLVDPCAWSLTTYWRRTQQLRALGLDRR
jgi:hypothetical protein